MNTTQTTIRIRLLGYCFVQLNIKIFSNRNSKIEIAFKRRTEAKNHEGEINHEYCKIASTMQKNEFGKKKNKIIGFSLTFS